ncbi:MAG: tetratricopeptide repeat protein [Myxococcota bacterium]|nr:tetratricopeptide repeat protein [Myxococcota bacterium]
MPSINKRKLLASAQRHVQKGALDKALKDYNTILDADPRDTNVRLKLGDLQLRRNQSDDAIAAYLKVADQFMRDGFDAKAVALYKQITKIDDKRHDVYLPLADLYQRLGLVSEAMGALQTAADAYHREGKKREALDLLRRMASLDPSNTTSRLKVADLLHQEDLIEEAIAEYDEAAAELDRQGDWETRLGVLQRIVEIAPDRVDTLEALARLQLQHGRADAGVAVAESLVAADDARAESHELLAELSKAVGDDERAVEAYRRCAQIWRERGDESRAREIMQRHVPSELFDMSGSGGGAVHEADGATLDFASQEADGSPFGEEGIGGAGDPNDDSLIDFGDDALDLGDTSSAGGSEAPSGAPLHDAADDTGTTETDAVDDDADVEQLLAETTVYLRYGKHERAITSLRAVLQREPDHIGALEQLGDALVATDAAEQAVEAWSRGARAAREDGDSESFQALVERIAEVDADAAAALGEGGSAPRASAPETVFFDSEDFAVDDAPESGASARGAPETVLFDVGEQDASGEADDVEIDLDTEAHADRDAEAEGEADADPSAFDASALEDIDIEIEDDDSPGGDETDPTARDPESLSAETEPEEPDYGDGFEIDFETAGDDAGESDEDHAKPPAAEAAPSEEIDLDDDALAAAFDEVEDDDGLAAAESPAEGAPAGGDDAEVDFDETDGATPPGMSTTTAERIVEDLEEASFYFEQGLYDEAEAIYQRILEVAPSHPGALLRVGEIAAARGEDPGDSSGSQATDEAPGAAAAGAAVEVELPSATDLTSPDLEPDAEATSQAESEAAAPEDGDEADTAPEPALEQTERDTAPEAPASRAEAEAEPDTQPEGAAAEAEAPEGEAETEEASFDLAAELSDVFDADDQDDPDGATGTHAAATDEDGFDSLFRDFKRGVSQTLGEGDAETHFDLGIAYREMGLLEDAIGEFQHALGAAGRQLDALHMMGLCALDLGRAQDAAAHFEQGLASPEVPAEQETALRYDLGRAYEAQGDAARALDCHRRVAELDADFQDVGERIGALERGETTPVTGAGGADEYESFDEFMADDGDDDQGEEGGGGSAETYESFDDVVADVSPAEPGETAEPEPPPEVDSEPAPEPEPDPGESGSGKRRRRKVSFF